jgi:hypothetical protein
MAHEAISRVRGEVSPLAIDPGERILGRLDAQLEYAEIGEIVSEGLPIYLQRIRAQIAETASSIQTAYFLH